MSPQRLKTQISRSDLRPELIKEMQEKEATASLKADAKDEILKYFFYKATEHNPLNLKPSGLQIPSAVFESPFRGATDEETITNIAYANACALHLIKQDILPFGSHIKYTGPLKDADAHERTVGIILGKIEEVHIPTVFTFVDRGLSYGMKKGLDLHTYLEKKLLFCNLDSWKGACTSSLTQEVSEIHKFERQYLEIVQNIDEVIGVKTI